MSARIFSFFLVVVLGLLTGCGSEATPQTDATRSPSTQSSPESSSPSPSAQSSSPLPTPSVSTTDQATSFGPFVRTWSGHTRYLEVDEKGRGVEHVGDGCCHPIYDAKLQLTDVSKEPWGWVAGFEILSIEVHDPKELAKPARVGATGTLTLKRGVLTSSIDDQVYCNDKAARRGVCGA